FVLFTCLRSSYAQASIWPCWRRHRAYSLMRQSTKNLTARGFRGLPSRQWIATKPRAALGSLRVDQLCSWSPRTCLRPIREGALELQPCEELTGNDIHLILVG